MDQWEFAFGKLRLIGLRILVIQCLQSSILIIYQTLFYDFFLVVIITFHTQWGFGAIFNTHLILDMTSPVS
jgi:hypothetical protein